MAEGKLKNWIKDNGKYAIPVYGSALWAKDAIKRASGGKKDIENDITQNKKDLESNLNNIPTYQIPKEAQSYLDMLTQTSNQLSDTSKPYNEAVDIARNQASMGEAPGSAMARQDIQQSTANQVQNIKEMGGGSVNALGAITDVGSSEQGALRDLAKSNIQYQAQAKQNLQGSLMGQSQFQGNLLSQQASLKGAGLQTMIGEQGKVQQSQLDKYLTMTDYELSKLGLSQLELENLKNRRAQMASSAITGVTSLGASFLTGGMSSMMPK